MKAFIVYPTYRIIEGQAYVYLFGRLENGKSFLSINLFRPYFFIKQKDLAKAKKIEYEFDSTSSGSSGSAYSNFVGEKLAKITLDVPKQVPELRKLFEESGIVCYDPPVVHMNSRGYSIHGDIK